MPKKEDRSDWVAVAPESTAATATKANDIPKAKTAFQFFQKERSEQLKRRVREENDGRFDVALLAKHTHRAWHHETSDADRSHFEELARRDAVRYAAASHAADVAALERKERLRAEREAVVLLDDDDEEDDDYREGGPTRTTRNQYEKKQRKKERRQKKNEKKRKSNGQGGSDFNDDDDEGEEEEDDWDSDVLDTDDSEQEKKKKATPKKTRPVSQKQLEYQARKLEEKQKKEAYMMERQLDIQKEKAGQAKRRLEFLLKQSDIFAHFGRVKEDQAKYGIVAAPPAKAAAETSNKGARRNAGETTANDDDDLNEADEHEATFLTAQPSTLGFGKMRDYQLEGLNWMIRLQENGVNGILADEVSFAIPGEEVPHHRCTIWDVCGLKYLLLLLLLPFFFLFCFPPSSCIRWDSVKRYNPFRY